MRQLGIIGLGTMGGNLARNAARNGAMVAVYNRTTEKTETFMAAHGSEGKFIPCKTIQELIAALTPPRVVLIMVNAGPAVDAVMQELIQSSNEQLSSAKAAEGKRPSEQRSLTPGDIIIDGGNSHFEDSERRSKDLAAKGIHFLGMGVSGGERGALEGPSMMPGGSREAYDALEPLLRKMAAKDGGGGKCVAYMGPGGAGHFAKMVHNGIEYAALQLIGEAYHLLRSVCGLENAALADLFERWNKGKDLRSYLIEITAKIFRKKDPDTGKDLLDVILDAAGQKGTGKWTTAAAMDLGVMIPTITAAVDARLMSAHKEERVTASKASAGMTMKVPRLSPASVKSALFLGNICSYAQGFALLRHASEVHRWNLDLAEISRIWKGGCIIRSALLKEFQRAFTEHPDLKNLLLDPPILQAFMKKHAAWRRVIAAGVHAGAPLPAMTASVSYFDGYFRERLPQNLLQAQRDFFGAHTYERTDKPGVFHTEWE